MFVKAIDIASGFTRPIHTISRNYGFTSATPGAATLFFVNADGWALTCKHVAQIIMASDDVKRQYQAFKKERDAIPPGRKSRNQLNLLERKFNYTRAVTVEIMNTFVNCVDGKLVLDIILHPLLDVALIKFRDYDKLLCDTFPIFATDGGLLRPGKSICRLGFPFPEFQNFEYDAAADEISWNSNPRNQTPSFPIDGMVTRLLLNDAGNVVGFELSTPGLKGQSGGPAFDIEGRVWGLQVATQHLDLDFDVDTDVVRAGAKKRVKDSAFLHVGHCLHIDVLKDFMRLNGVNFQEG